jgi:nitrite reductase/ring-hydroxylating ferredoxin subunit
VGTLADLEAANPGLPVADGFPAYVPAARAFVILVDPARGGWQPGIDATGDGLTLNVRALSQVCPHLGCRPNPCLDDFWFHCPCHQSRYDRLGIKAAGERFGPAPRGMDRLAIEVSDDGVLTIDTGLITLGPLPVALGQPGLIPPRVENGCV